MIFNSDASQRIRKHPNIVRRSSMGASWTELQCKKMAACPGKRNSRPKFWWIFSIYRGSKYELAGLVPVGLLEDLGRPWKTFRLWLHMNYCIPGSIHIAVPSMIIHNYPLKMQLGILPSPKCSWCGCVGVCQNSGTLLPVHSKIFAEWTW